MDFLQISKHFIHSTQEHCVLGNTYLQRYDICIKALKVLGLKKWGNYVTSLDGRHRLCTRCCAGVTVTSLDGRHRLCTQRCAGVTSLCVSQSVKRGYNISLQVWGEDYMNPRRALRTDISTWCSVDVDSSLTVTCYWQSRAREKRCGSDARQSRQGTPGTNFNLSDTECAL